MVPLPIDPFLPEIRSALASHRAVILAAPPGAGKTTQVPLALLDEHWLDDGRIVMLEPRRLAARTAAQRMSLMRGESVGMTIGYRTREDTRVSSATRIEVITEGILTRMLQNDLALDGIALIIFDEFHERSLTADAGLAMTLAVQASLRDDLRVLVMSATLDHIALRTLLPEAPVIAAAGRAFDVETRHSPPPPGVAREAHLARVVRGVVTNEPGSVLAFLPGVREIRRAADLLGDLPHDVDVFALHGSLSMAEQDRAIAPPSLGRRKVVLATSIAEASLTIEGIRVVVDSGMMRVPRFSPRTGMTRLETIRVSRASADQRRGRAGRTEPGLCIRCWSAADEAGLVPFSRPEILEADLAPLILDLAAAGFSDFGELRWLDAPPAAAIAQGRDLLRQLGALDERDRITSEGKRMAAIGTAPRLAHMLVRAAEAGRTSLRVAATIAALLEERDILRGEGGAPSADLALRVDVVARDNDDRLLEGAAVDRAQADRVRRAAREWQRRVAPSSRDDVLSVGAVLSFAYPDRIAQRRDAAGRFLLRNGRGASVPSRDPLAQSEWIVIASLDDTGRDARVSLAAPIDRDEVLELLGDQFRSTESVEWDASRHAVVSRRRTMLGALTIREHTSAEVDAQTARAVLVALAGERGGALLRWSDGAKALRQRLAFLHRHLAGWPDVSDDALRATVPEWIAGGGELDAAQFLESRLDWQQRRELDRVAPLRISLPGGGSAAVDYTDADNAVLAVQLQKVFGWKETPRIAGGTVPVTLHLLSPARRPVQVTRDLASFWKTGYFDVRRELRGRYPRHRWPERPDQE